MNFNLIYRILFYFPVFFLIACSDATEESNLLNLHTVASQDLIEIKFPDVTEKTVSINSLVDFTVQGITSNNDLKTVTSNIKWSLSAGAISSINQNGLLTAGDSAETITLTASLGFLSTSLDIKVSSAKFDHVKELHESTFSLDMCQSKPLIPVGVYIDLDENGNEVEEIRPVDNTILDSIVWVISDPDNNPSFRGYLETSNSQPVLHTLAAGNLSIQAKATSLWDQTEKTSDFNQVVGNELNSIKLCLSNAEDLTNCTEVTSERIEEGEDLSLIAVGKYTNLEDNSFYYENITKKSKWGNSNILNASSAFSSDLQLIKMTGLTPLTSVVFSAACGDILQSLDEIEIEEGVNLNTSISCDIDCKKTSELTVSIDNLSVLSFEVSANDIDLTHDVSINLSTSEITLDVLANLSNDSQLDITGNESLSYTIIDIAGQFDVIQETDSQNIFTVLEPGTAKIQLDFRGETFMVVIEIP